MAVGAPPLYGGFLRFARGGEEKEDRDRRKGKRGPRSRLLRNRERLLLAAREVFAEGGPGASLEAVARPAEVGIGTLYRHFPTREALFQAVYSNEIDELVELAKRLAETRSGRGSAAVAARQRRGDRDQAGHAHRAGSGPRQLQGALCLSARGCRAVGELMRSTRPTERSGATSRPKTPAGVLRHCYTRDGPDWQATVIRLVDIFVDGLRRPS